MERSLKRLLVLFVGLVVLVILSAFFYMWGMFHLEGESRDFWQSLGSDQSSRGRYPLSLG